MPTYSSKSSAFGAGKVIVKITGDRRISPSTSGSSAITGLGALYPRYDGYGARGNQVLIVTVPSGAAYQIPNVNSDVIVIVNKTTGSPTTIYGRTTPSVQFTDTIKDGKGDAVTNNITFVPGFGLVDAASTAILNTSFSSITLVYNGTDYYKV